MDNPNPIYYRDLITPDDSITKLLAQLDALIAKYDTAQEKIKGSAQETAKAMGNLSGATEEQRQEIALLTTETDKLAKAYKESNDAESEVYRRRQQTIMAVKEQQKIDKLVVQLNTSAEGSYNRLSAQYRLNKIRLNEMSLAERQGTEAGRALEAETNAIYEEMKRLQEATGKHQLNVGNYTDATKGLRTEMMELINQMAQMKLAGETNSDEYKAMAKRAGQLKDAMLDAQTEVKAMASDTASLDSAMGLASSASGGINAVVGTMSLVGAKSESASDAQKNLASAVGVVSGLIAVQNALQKESTVMLGIRTIQTRLATKAEQLDTVAKNKNTIATARATIAQKAFNLVAKANPYVLLALALVTVVGALVAFSVGANRSAKEQERLNKALSAQLDYMEALAEETTRVNNERAKALSDEVEIAKARNASLQEIRKLEDEIYKERVTAHDKEMNIYGEQLASLDANRAKVEELRKTLLKLQEAQARGKNRIRVDVDLDGNLERTKIDKAIEAVQGQIDNLGRSVKVAVELQTEGQDIAKERAIQLAQRKTEAEQIAKTELDALRAGQDARLALIADGYKRESATLRASAQRQIEDLRTRLRTETNLTAKARQAISDQIRAIALKLERDLEDLRNTYTARDLTARRETEDITLNIMQEGAEKERELLRVEYQRKIEDLTTSIATQRNLTERQVAEMYNQLILLGEEYRKAQSDLEKDLTADALNAEATRLQLRLDATTEGSQEELDLILALMQKQRAIELQANAQLSEDVRQSEADINAKWDAEVLRKTTELTQKRALLILDNEQALEASEMDLLERNERQRTLFQLQQEKARLEAILRLDEEAGVKMTETERKTIENTIKAIEKEASKVPYNNIFELLGIGLDKERVDALKTATGSIKESISGIIQSWNALAEASVNSATKQVESAQRVLDAEIEARNAGYANEVLTAQKELDLAKRNQEQAIRERQKAQKAQASLDSLTQASSLVTASANIWSSLSGIPIVGSALAIAAIAAMWASFAGAKIKASQVTKQEQYGEGTVELLEGGSHASGHDIDLGTKADGTRRRAEGGEYFAVINKRNSRKYRGIIPDVINAFNNGNFAERYQKATDTMSGLAVGLIGGGSDLSTLEKDVSSIRRQGDRSTYVDGQGNTIMKYKNLTRKILR